MSHANAYMIAIILENFFQSVNEVDALIFIVISNITSSKKSVHKCFFGCLNVNASIYNIQVFNKHAPSYFIFSYHWVIIIFKKKSWSCHTDFPLLVCTQSCSCVNMPNLDFYFRYNFSHSILWKLLV